MRRNVSLVFAATIALFVAGSADAAGKKHRKKASVLPDTTAIVAPAPEPDSLFAKVKVGPSQTASWIAFRQLGAWTPEIRERLRADNPDLKSLDELEVGQILRLRRSLDQRRLAPAQQVSQALRKAVATLVKGNVQVQAAGEAATRSLRANEFLSPGDRIVLGTGDLVELIIDNQSVMRLRDKAVLTLTAIQANDSSATRTTVSLDLGRLWSRVRKWAGPLVGFQVKMPNAIAGVHGTTFECFVDADSTSLVNVHEGLVGVRNRLGAPESPIAAGKSVVVNKSGDLTQPAANAPSAPDWNRFNEQRDESMDEQVSVQKTDLEVTRSPMNNESAAKKSGLIQKPVLRPK